MASRAGDPMVAFLRTLGAALGTARLYPGDDGRQELVEAVERARHAAAAALSADRTEAEIVGGRFAVEAGSADPEPHLDRLAQACYERRVEHVAVRGRPTRDDVLALLGVLTTPVEELAPGESRFDYLRVRGVTTLSLATAVPQPTTGRGVPDGDLVEGEPATWSAPPDPGTLEVEVSVLPNDTAQTLYERLRAVHDARGDDTTARSMFFERAAEAVSTLLPAARAAFGRLCIDRAQDDAFAMRYLGHLSDLGLTELTIDVASAEGADPVRLARDIIALTGRHHEIVRIVEAAILDAALADGTGPAHEGSSAAVSTTLVVDDEATAALRDAFPTKPDEVRALALRCLRDYTVLEDDRERLERVLITVAHQVREACRTRDVPEVQRLVGVLDEVELAGDAAVASMVETQRRTVLDAALVTSLAVSAASGGDTTVATGVLRPLRAPAVDALVGALHAADAPNVRNAIVVLLADLVRDDVGRLSVHLDDPEWFVVRNLATVLGRVGSAQAVAALATAARHEHPKVRHEALRSLVAINRSEAVDALARLARIVEARHQRVEFLSALAEHPHAAAVDRLDALGRRSSPPRLPWALRRQARRLARQRRGER